MVKPKGLQRDTPMLRLIAQQRQRIWYHQLFYDIRCLRRIEYCRLQWLLSLIPALYLLLAIVHLVIFPYWQSLCVAASAAASCIHAILVESVTLWLLYNMLLPIIDAVVNSHSQSKNCKYSQC